MATPFFLHSDGARPEGLVLAKVKVLLRGGLQHPQLLNDSSLGNLGLPQLNGCSLSTINEVFAMDMQIQWRIKTGKKSCTTFFK
jgi:hypothetical protein